MPEQDDDVTGDMGPIEITGTWGQSADDYFAKMLSEPVRRTMTITPKSSRWLWVNWYPYAYVSASISSGWKPVTESDLGLVTFTGTFVADEPFVIMRAEWWRRLGYYVIARPLGLIAWHGYQRWRRDDEED